MAKQLIRRSDLTESSRLIYPDGGDPSGSDVQQRQKKVDLHQRSAGEATPSLLIRARKGDEGCDQ